MSVIDKVKNKKVLMQLKELVSNKETIGKEKIYKILNNINNDEIVVNCFNLLINNYIEEAFYSLQFLESDELKKQYYETYKDSFPAVYYKYTLIESMNNDIVKMQIIKNDFNLDNYFFFSSVIESLNNDLYKEECVKIVRSFFKEENPNAEIFVRDIVVSYKSDKLKEKYVDDNIKNGHMDNLIYVISSIRNDDQYKIDFIKNNELQTSDITRIISSFFDYENILKYISLVNLEQVEYILSNNIILDSCIENILKNGNKYDEKACYYVAMYARDDKTKESILKYIENKKYRAKIISTLFNNAKKIEYLKEDFDYDLRFLIISHINDAKTMLDLLDISPENIDLDSLYPVIMYYVNNKWLEFYNDNSEMFTCLDTKLIDFAEKIGYSRVLMEFSPVFKTVCRVVNMEASKLSDILIEYKETKDLQKLKEISKQFYNLYKEQYIAKEYSRIKTQVKDNFYLVDREKVREKLIIDIKKNKYIKMSSKHQEQEYLKELLAPYNFNGNYEEFVKYALLGDEDKLLELLNITKPNNIDVFNKSKSLLRLNQNYLPVIKKMDINIVKILSMYIAEEVSYEYVKENCDKSVLKIITDIYNLANDASAILSLDNNNISFNVSYSPLDIKEINDINLYLKEKLKVKKIGNKIAKRMNEVITSNISVSDNEIDKYIEKTPLDDSFYKASNYKLFRDCKSYPVAKALVYKITEDEIKENDPIVDLFIKNKLLTKLFMVSHDEADNDVDKLLTIIDNLNVYCEKFGIKNVSIADLEKIIKYTSLYGYLEDETEQVILGNEVLRKLVFGETFIYKKNKETRTKRLNKAVKLLVDDMAIIDSTIPYVSVRGKYTVERYNNTDPNAITCGIDTDACVRLDAPDNDFLIYSLKSKNGIIVKITDENGNFVGRINGFRNGNILYFNQARTIYDVHFQPLKKTNEEQREIREYIEEFSRKIIEESSKTSEPIEHVVIVKAYDYADDEEKKNVNKALVYDPISSDTADYESFRRDPLLRDPSRKSFRTDYETNLDLILLASREGTKLEKEGDFKRYDPSPLYVRPRKQVKRKLSYTDLLEHINRINALWCYVGNSDEQYKKRCDYQKLIGLDNIKSYAIGEDWYDITLQDGTRYSCVLPMDKRAYAEYYENSLELEDEHAKGYN